MLQRNRSLIWQLAAIGLIGILASKIDPWARRNPEDYLGSAQLILMVIMFFGFAFQGASGKLKSGPDRRKSTDAVKRHPAIPVLMAGYLFILAIAAITSVFLGFRLDDHIASPLVCYFVLVPIALIEVLGRHRAGIGLQNTKPKAEESPAKSFRNAPSLTEMTRDFFEEKLLVAVIFCLFSLLCFGIWLDLDDEGALVAGILFAGFSVQQYYRHVLQRRESSDSSDS